VTVAAAILAAGAGTRFQGVEPKALAEYHGAPLITWALLAARESGLRPVLVVVGANAERVAELAGSDVRVVHSEEWESGIAHSLHAALDELEPDESVDAVCIGLADQPRVGAEAYRRLAAAHATGARFAVAVYDGVRGNPALLDREVWPAARRLEGDVGARALMKDGDVVEVDCTGTGDPRDVDTLEDLRTLEGDAS
jgi:molybdenum cofactor cytidylyltransferase